MPSLRNSSRSRSRGRTPSLRSRPSRPTSLHRYRSHGFLDSQSYHNHGDNAEEAGDDSSEFRKESSTTDLEKEAAEEEELEHEEEEAEVFQERDEDVAPRGFDLEKATIPLEKTRSTQSRRSKKGKDPNIVTWEGPDDPKNPRNWSLKRKWAATFIVSSFTFISPVSSSMVAPALGAISAEFGVTNEVVSAMILSIFILAYAVGPLIFGPLSEVYGRVPVLQIGNLFYLIFNIVCGFSKNTSQMLAFRFLSGLGGAAPLAIGGGVIGDCWAPEQRGKAISIYSLAPLLGPAIGPIAGGFITENTTWRWAFWATSIADVLIQISGVFFLQETFAPKLLHNKVVRLRKETGNQELRSEFEVHYVPLQKKLRTSLIRPFRLLFTQPIIQVLAVYMAFLYGLTYLVLATFPTLWTGEYGESVGIGGLNYISLGVGFFIGAQSTARFNDRIYRHLKKKRNGVGQPEFRVPGMVPGALLVPIGLFWYGWSAQAHVHWIMPNIGAAIFSAGIIIGFQCIQTYIVDSYTLYAASGIAAATFLRSLAGFGFPLFASYMYARLGNGWGNSLLAFLALVLGIPGPFLLWRYGPMLRAKSKFAAGGY